MITLFFNKFIKNTFIYKLFIYYKNKNINSKMIYEIYYHENKIV